ncbi:HAD family hydrolase, partial [Litorivivens sp.]
MALAIFDLDNTLLGGDSDHAWGEFLVDRNLVDGEAFREANDRFYEQYKDGGLDIHAYLRFALEPLTRFSRAELDELHR